ncbi:MAG TPA: hypothetical protein VJA94_07780 [Candidatus Angelobacter sp.]
MKSAQTFLERISNDQSLAEQLRQGNLAAFEKLNLSFDQLYGSVGEADEFDEQAPAWPCDAVTCDVPSCIVTRQGLTE